jgi:hypothetical protein
VLADQLSCCAALNIDRHPLKLHSRLEICEHFRLLFFGIWRAIVVPVLKRFGANDDAWVSAKDPVLHGNGNDLAALAVLDGETVNALDFEAIRATRALLADPSECHWLQLNVGNVRRSRSECPND